MSDIILARALQWLGQKTSREVSRCPRIKDPDHEPCKKPFHRVQSHPKMNGAEYREHSVLTGEIAQIVEKACRESTNCFGYSLWTHHILLVVKYAKLMAGKLPADEEIAEIAALLHDYASVKDPSLYEDHHIHGAELAEKILRQRNCPLDRIERVKLCILSHRGSKPLKKLTKEAICVADADSMAHFDSISSLFYLAFCRHKMNIDEANDWIRQKLERSWNKLSPEAKDIIKDKYKASRLLLSGNEQSFYSLSPEKS